MAKNKTTETEESVEGFITKIKEENRKKDFSTLVELIKKNTKLDPKMWGTSIVGFGSYSYKYESGREGTAPLLGLASRSAAITLYFGSSFQDREELLAKLGKHKTGKGCIYVQKVEDIDLTILSQMVKNVMQLKKKH